MPHAIGFQVSAAYLGTAALPGAAGVLARWHGLEVIGLVLVSAAAGLLTLHEIAVRMRREAVRARAVARNLVWWTGRAGPG